MIAFATKNAFKYISTNPEESLKAEHFLKALHEAKSFMGLGAEEFIDLATPIGVSVTVKRYPTIIGYCAPWAFPRTCIS